MRHLAKVSIILFLISPHAAQSDVTVTLEKIDKHVEFTVCNKEQGPIQHCTFLNSSTVRKGIATPTH